MVTTYTGDCSTCTFENNDKCDYPCDQCGKSDINKYWTPKEKPL